MLERLLRCRRAAQLTSIGIPKTSSQRSAPLTPRRVERWFATEAANASHDTTETVPGGGAGDAQVNRIVDDISKLTLLQAAQLVTSLKTRLNIQEIALASPVAAPAPAAEQEANVEEKPKEKTIFNVKLESFDAASKPKIIKEVKATVPNLNLIEAKKFVESLPKVVKENLPKDEAEKLKQTFEALGAKVILE